MIGERGQLRARPRPDQAQAAEEILRQKYGADVGTLACGGRVYV